MKTALWILNDAAQLVFAVLVVWLLFSGTWSQLTYAVIGFKMAASWKLAVDPKGSEKLRKWFGR